MADLKLKARPPYGRLAIPGRYGAGEGDAGVTIAARPDLILKQISAGQGKVPALVEVVHTATGLALPKGTKRAAIGGLALIGVAPSQWLAVADGPEAVGLLWGLEESLSGVATVTDQSDGKAVLRLAGPRARDVLAKGCPLDLHERVFKPGDAATTQMALIPAQIWQLDNAPTYELAAASSYAGSFWSWLTASAAEFGYVVLD